ncbi:MAG: hypothetical protein WC069_07225 [Candidatus Shapirobacteria bacterium]
MDNNLASPVESYSALGPAPVKPGYLTTEFIGKCAVQLIAILVLTGIIPTDDQSRATEIALGLIAAVESAYAFSRGIVKRG